MQADLPWVSFLHVLWDGIRRPSYCNSLPFTVEVRERQVGSEPSCELPPVASLTELSETLGPLGMQPRKAETQGSPALSNVIIIGCFLAGCLDLDFLSFFILWLII